MNNTHKVGFTSLGCPKATVDAERILTQLRAEGYQLVDNYKGADLVVINTCGFIDAAVDESMDAIAEAINENGKVVVTGCLGAKPEVIMERHPQVLAIAGPDSLHQTMQAIHQHLPPKHDPHFDLVPEGGLKLTPRHYAYMKIAEGCNQQCSFCIIPSLRGKLQSRPLEIILDEAERLVNDGVRELLLVAQDTAAYGVDLNYRTSFWQGKPVKNSLPEMINHLAKLDVWVRLHYLYPYPAINQLVELMQEGKVLPYLDIPLQHASPTILKQMRRPANQENMLQRISSWREKIPQIALRSTFIVGFPGESSADFEMLLNFIKEVEFDRAGAFAYSDVDGAPANGLADPVSEEIKQERLERFMEIQSAISANKLQQRVGEEALVVIDSIDAEGEAIGRSYAESPDIDGVIVVTGEGLEVGDFVDVRIDASDEHDLYATVTG